MEEDCEFDDKYEGGREGSDSEDLSDGDDNAFDAAIASLLRKETQSVVQSTQNITTSTTASTIPLSPVITNSQALPRSKSEGDKMTVVAIGAPLDEKQQVAATGAKKRERRKSAEYLGSGTEKKLKQATLCFVKY